MTEAAQVPSPSADAAMRHFDASRLARLNRSRLEGLVALGLSIALSACAWATWMNTRANTDAHALLTVANFLTSAACVLAWVAVLRIFQAATLGPSSKVGAVADHAAILLGTFYVVWFLAKVAAIWE